MRQKGIINIVILITGLLFLGIGAYFIYFKKSGSVAQPTTPTLTPDNLTRQTGDNLKQAAPQKKISSFVYQLQNTDYNTLLSANFDLAVIDWEEAGLSRSQLPNLKNQNKKIVSYLSIGEAEDYRDYWQNWENTPPPFLEKENPDWEGNYKVRYWDRNWQNIIFEKLNTTMDMGYDGVYLDLIDAYYYFEEQGRSTAKGEMIGFVAELSKRAKTKNPNFLIIPQNSPELVENENYLSAIDGLGKEDTWYYDNEPRNVAELEIELSYLEQVVQSGKFVLVIDYPTEKQKQCDFIKRARSNGFIPFVSNRELNKIEAISCD